jgi:hypothetical protein
MRPQVLSGFLFIALVLPSLGNAQITYRPTPPPQITAANATWQINGEPIFVAGSYYLPAGPTVFFDGKLMQRIGEYRTVPVYVDTTMEAFSVVFIPIGGAVMKPYERRRAGVLAGTTGSSTPSWPVQVSADIARTDGGVGLNVGEPLMLADAQRPVGTSGDVIVNCGCPSGTTGAAGAAAAPAPPVERTAVETVARPTSNTGISIEFQGARWVSDGPAVSYFPERFAPVGDYRGFPVYRDKSGSADTIYVTSVANGPLAPYSRR